MADQGTSNFAALIANALMDGSAVAIKIEGEHGWETVTHVGSGPEWGPLLEVRRARDGHTLFLPAGRIVAVDVGVRRQ